MNDILGFTLVIVIVFLMGALTGKALTKNYYRMEAIKQGYAEYVVTDPFLGSTEFQWKTNILDNTSSM